MSILNHHIYGNSLLQWVIALALFLVVPFLLRLLRRGIVKRVHRTSPQHKTSIDSLLFRLAAKTKIPFLYLIGLWAAAQTLTLTSSMKQLTNNLALFAFFAQAGFWGNELINVWIESEIRKRKDTDSASVTAFGAIGFVLRLTLTICVLILLLDNFGFEVRTLVAGLGVGSIAVALAVQNILGDVFCSFSIILDKPFEVGDFIVVDQFMGQVEHIGIKSTRLRSLQGEQIVISNASLVASRIQNFKRMSERRVLFTIGVVYHTPLEKLRTIPGMIRQIIESKQSVRFDRAHFKQFGESALNFEVVYYVLTSEYNTYMDIQQSVNLDIVRAFEAEGIEFAYPTQTLYIEKAA